MHQRPCPRLRSSLVPSSCWCRAPALPAASACADLQMGADWCRCADVRHVTPEECPCRCTPALSHPRSVENRTAAQQAGLLRPRGAVAFSARSGRPGGAPERALRPPAQARRRRERGGRAPPLRSPCTTPAACSAAMPLAMSAMMEATTRASAEPSVDVRSQPLRAASCADRPRMSPQYMAPDVSQGAFGRAWAQLATFTASPSVSHPAHSLPPMSTLVAPQANHACALQSTPTLHGHTMGARTWRTSAASRLPAARGCAVTATRPGTKAR